MITLRLSLKIALNQADSLIKKCHGDATFGQYEGMANPADLAEVENWAGGTYGLGLRLPSPVDEGTLQSVLDGIWRSAPIWGDFVLDSQSGPIATPSAVQASEVRIGQPFRGITNAADIGNVVCEIGVLELSEHGTWVWLGLPLGALTLIEPRIGGFPFEADGNEQSLEWRLPIDAWLAQVAIQVAEIAPVEMAVLGFEAPDFSGGNGLNTAGFGILQLVEGRLHYFPAVP